METQSINSTKYDYEEEEMSAQKKQEFIKANKLVFIGKDGWPVEGIAGKRFFTFIRRLILTTKIMRYKTWRKRGGCMISFR